LWCFDSIHIQSQLCFSLSFGKVIAEIFCLTTASSTVILVSKIQEIVVYDMKLVNIWERPWINWIVDDLQPPGKILIRHWSINPYHCSYLSDRISHTFQVHSLERVQNLHKVCSNKFPKCTKRVVQIIFQNSIQWLFNK